MALSAEAADIEASYDNVLALDTPSLNGKFPDHFVTVHLSADNTNGKQKIKILNFGILINFKHWFKNKAGKEHRCLSAWN